MTVLAPVATSDGYQVPESQYYCVYRIHYSDIASMGHYFIIVNVDDFFL